MQDRLRLKDALLEAVQTEGLPGVIRVSYLMVDPNGISAECIAEADNAFESAANSDQVWDAALGMAECLRNAPLFDVADPEEPEPEPEPDPNFGADKANTVGAQVLAAFLVQLRGQAKS